MAGERAPLRITVASEIGPRQIILLIDGTAPSE
jgi:hypothetical protein